MEWPLIALAENVRDELLRRSIVIAQEIALDAIGIDGIDVRQALCVRSRQIPGKSIARRADPELTFRQIHRLHARLERKSEGTEAMLGVDAVAIEFAGSAGRDDEVSASDDGKPARVLGSAIRCMKCEQTGDTPRFVVGH